MRKKPLPFPDCRLRERMASMRKSGMFPEKLAELDAKYGEMLRKAGYGHSPNKP